MSQLDLKYRPLNFKDVIGNNGIKKLLLTRSKKGTLSDQSMMLSGPKGCGKTTLARIITRAISCTNLQDGEPCNECSNCLSILNETSLNFKEIDAASQGTVDHIRDMVKDADYESIDGIRQVYIIDEAQRLSQPAQEAFLKAIESRLFTVIFCTTDPQKVKSTIRSRLEEYPITPPDASDLRIRMSDICNSEHIDYDESSLDIIIKMKENCPRACFIAIDSLSQLGDINEDNVKEFFRFGSYQQISNLLELVDINPSKSFEILDDLASKESPTWIRDNIVMAISSALRAGVGAKTNFPVITDFFSNRGRSWSNVAITLSLIDRPNIHDIESVLLKESKVIMDVPNVQDVITQRVIIKTPEESKITEVIAEPKVAMITNTPTTDLKNIIEITEVSKAPDNIKSRKQITVDGVSFSSDELLTSLDSKINTNTNNQNTSHVKKDKEDFVKVQLNLDNAPITEKAFTSGLLSRLRK